MNRRSWTHWLISTLLIFGQAAGAMPMASMVSDVSTVSGAVAADHQNTATADPTSMHDCGSRSSENTASTAQMIMDVSCPENCDYCAAACVGVAVAVSAPLTLLFSSADHFAERPISSPAHRITGLFRPPITA